MGLSGPPRRALILTFAATLLAAPALTQSARPGLTLGTGTRAPLVTSAGRPGFVEEVVRDALRRLGYDLTVLPLPIERSLINANAGIEDGDLFRAAGFERDYPNLIRVAEPLIEQDFVAFTLRPDIEVRDWSDLARYSVAHITGQKVIERHLKGARNVTTVREHEQLPRLLANGRADLVIDNRWVGMAVAREAGIATRVLEPPLLRVSMYVYLHRRHEALVAPLAKALAEGKRDGTWQRLYDQILGAKEPAR